MTLPRNNILQARAREMRRIATQPEQVLWQVLRNRGLRGLKFRRQVPIGAFIVDFFCQEARLIVEIDGASHVDGDRDVRRDGWLRAQGFGVLRVWNNEVMRNLDGVLLAILAASQAPHPDPLPKGEGEGN